jgi:enolase
MKTAIRSVTAREILDSRGIPTVEVDLTLACDITARASSPSGATAGMYEAVELRDQDANRYRGRGVRRAVEAIATEIAPMVVDLDALDQLAVDQALCLLDGTPKRERCGTNALLAVSIAIARAAARAEGRALWQHLAIEPRAVSLPVPCMNVLSGGEHARWQGPDFREYLIAPYGAPSFAEALRWGAEVYHALREALVGKGQSVCVSDKGGFVPSFEINNEPLDLIVAAIEEAGYSPGREIGIALNVGSSGFFKNKVYRLRTEDLALGSADLVHRYQDLVETYPIVSIEDGLAENDWAGWRHLTTTLGHRVELIGGEIFATNLDRIERGIRSKVSNSVLIKPGQAGTVTATGAAVRMALDHGWGVMVSDRSGETGDTFIADFTVAMGTGKLEAGAPARGERVGQYNRLLRIEEEMGSRSRFAGRGAFVR